MNKIAALLVASATLISVAYPVMAKSEKQVTRVTYELSDFPSLEASAVAVCGGKASMSDKLKAACETKKFPSVTKAGNFRNTGIGAELNTLIRQVKADVGASRSQ